VISGDLGATLSRGRTPLVSIVIPVFNQAAYLEQAIESALAQDYRQVEVTVIDDGSTDETPRILERFRARCVIDRHANRGQSETLNGGWRRSRGQILSYLSADDVLRPQAVRRAVETLLAHPDAVLSYSDYDLIDRRSAFITRVHAPEYNYADMALRLVCAPGPGPFFWRRAFERAGPWNRKLRQTPDYEFWLRLALEGRFIRIPEVLAEYRLHEDSQSFRGGPVECAEELVGVLTDYLRHPGLPDEIASRHREALGWAHILTARLHLRAHRAAHAARHLISAVCLYPPAVTQVRPYRVIAGGLTTSVRRKFGALFS
jgi:glycosyltransferase involved in cell wall biosynthesis